MHIFCLWGAFFGVKALRSRYGNLTFISIAFQKKNGWRFVLILMILFSSLNFFFIQLNEVVFDEKLKTTCWKITREKDAVIFIKDDKEKEEIWSSANNELQIIYQKKANKIKSNNEYYIIWNEYKKLSFNGLTRCVRYMKNNDFDTTALILQWHLFVAGIFLITALLLCGYAFAWMDGIRELCFCTIAAHWMHQLSIFLSINYAIFFLWFNVVFWFLIGIWYLL